MTSVATLLKPRLFPVLSSQVFAHFGRLFCLFVCLLAYFIAAFIVCFFAIPHQHYCFELRLPIDLAIAFTSKSETQGTIVWISRLRARLNRRVARSGEPVDFTGLYMQVSFTNLSKEWREL